MVTWSDPPCLAGGICMYETLEEQDAYGYTWLVKRCRKCGTEISRIKSR